MSLPSRIATIESSPCQYRNFCENYNPNRCNFVSIQETCMLHLEFSFEDKELERRKEERERGTDYKLGAYS